MNPSDQATGLFPYAHPTKSTPPTPLETTPRDILQ